MYNNTVPYHRPCLLNKCHYFDTSYHHMGWLKCERQIWKLMKYHMQIVHFFLLCYVFPCLLHYTGNENKIFLLRWFDTISVSLIYLFIYIYIYIYIYILLFWLLIFIFIFVMIYNRQKLEIRNCRFINWHLLLTFDLPSQCVPFHDPEHSHIGIISESSLHTPPLAQQNILHGSEYKKINEKHIITTGARGTDQPPFF